MGNKYSVTYDLIDNNIKNGILFYIKENINNSNCVKSLYQVIHH